MEALKELKRTVIHINSQPIGTRILGNLMLLVLLALFVFSAVVMAIVAWELINYIPTEHFQPSIEGDEGWDADWGMR